MFEKWELRTDDIDIKYCKSKKIKVAGTWEEFPNLNIFSYVGLLAMKMVFQLNLEIFKNEIFIWSNDSFGDKIKQTFEKNGSEKVHCSIDENQLYNHISNCDFIFICDYDEEKCYFKSGGILNLKKIKDLNPYIKIIHLFGSIDYTLVAKNNIPIFPNYDGKPRTMSKTLNYLGPKPILKLLTSGFKVGEYLTKNQSSKLVQIL